MRRVKLQTQVIIYNANRSVSIVDLRQAEVISEDQWETLINLHFDGFGNK